MAVTQSELVKAWRAMFDLCKVHGGETVTLLTRPGANPQNLAAAYHALEDIGCQVMELQPLVKKRPLRENKVAMEALRNSDFILDFTGIHLLVTYELDLITEKGARMLYVVEPPEALIRLMPTPEDKARCERAGEKMRKARTMRVQSEAGTDMTVSIGDYKVLLEYGYADDPGHWDHWPAGFLATWPNEYTANGSVVLDAGDIIFRSSPTCARRSTWTSRAATSARSRAGWTPTCLREFLAQYNDPEAFAVSHLGWGLNERARWTALHMLGQGTNGNDGRSFAGNFLFSTGPNTDGGGKRNTLGHLDIPMRNCSVSLDGEYVTERGKLLDN